MIIGKGREDHQFGWSWRVAAKVCLIKQANLQSNDKQVSWENQENPKFTKECQVSYFELEKSTGGLDCHYIVKELVNGVALENNRMLKVQVYAHSDRRYDYEKE